MNPVMISLILFSVLLNSAAQLLLKAGMGKIGAFQFTTDNIWPIAMKIAMNFGIMGGLCIYVFSVLVWLTVLSRVDVSLAYPMTSIGYIVTAVAGFTLFQENLSLTRIIGILVIMAGVYLITRS